MLTTISTLDALRSIRPAMFSSIPATKGSYPHYNVRVDEANNSAVYEVSLPGYAKADIEVRYGNNRLTVSSTVNDLIDTDSSGYVVRMFGRRPFQLSWSVSDAQVAKATMADGILTITMLRNVNETADRVVIE
jgi:HSP20 family molecular chaperone IbpA